ncbi:3-oxoacyl-ACP reductase [Flavobacterium sp. LB3P45]|uniref:3-oxoacyl-ACP reductase n=1 Tax=Flavobacterium fructosi TaxID=3230416 RepID=A0ABW6HMX4_9FLAO
MKKAILTIGLFSLVMVLTSFTTQESNTTTKSDTNINIVGGTGTSQGNVKVDIVGGTGTSQGNVKVDIVGGTGTSQGNVKVD